MNRSPYPHTMGNMYRNPRPYNNKWKPRVQNPQSGHQWRPNGNFRPPVSNVNNEEHWCETCDRGFHTADLLDKHKQQHQKCNIDGCQFVAHPKVITKHIQMQHSSGLYKKIAKLDNPEEIQKWREERKKKYPTKINIEKKAAECKEKIERGEKMALKRDRNENLRSSDQPSGVKRKYSNDKNNRNQRTTKPNANQRHHTNNIPNKNEPSTKKIPKMIPKVPTIVEKNKLKPFTGILTISMDTDDKEDSTATDCNATLIEDDYYEEPTEQIKEKPIQEPVLCGALTSLMCEYGSSDEDTPEKENVVDNIKTSGHTEAGQLNNNSKKVVKPINDNIKNVLVNEEKDMQKNKAPQSVNTNLGDKAGNSDDDSGPEEVKTIKENSQEHSSYQVENSKIKEPPVAPKKKNVPKVNHRQNNNNKYKHKIPSTLLQKLLHKEIRQERNIVLQCIRYIKKMNYFEKSQ